MAQALDPQKRTISQAALWKHHSHGDRQAFTSLNFLHTLLTDTHTLHLQTVICLCNFLC